MFHEAFYPTPYALAQKMAYMVDIKFIESVLEPSAGKIDLLKPLAERMNHHRNRYGTEKSFEGLDIDTIEIVAELRDIIKGHGLRVVHDDFMTFNTMKRYDLIIMNPPFSQGARHLLKALEMQKNGGQILCLLNAETIRRPYTNERQELQARLQEVNAKIEFISDAFRHAERATPVDVALIHVNIEKKPPISGIIKGLRKAADLMKDELPGESYGALVDNDFNKAAVQQFNFEIQAGLQLIGEYEAMRPYLLDRFKKPGETYNYSRPILSLKIDGGGRGDKAATINKYIRQVRAKYWGALLNHEQFVGLLTTNLREEYHNRIRELSDYDFTLFNILTIKEEMSRNMVRGVEDTILTLFDTLSHKHSWYDETSRNIHYYNGWKTNTSYKINKKVIIPLAAHSSWGNSWDYSYTVLNKLTDIEKVFNYLDGGITEPVDLRTILEAAGRNDISKKIRCKFFTLDFYKKGTCHITFNDMALLEKFNIFGSQKKGWLPPVYGKKRYTDMSTEEKAIVDDFQGEKEYEKVMANTDFYLFYASKALQLVEHSEV